MTAFSTDVYVMRQARGPLAVEFVYDIAIALTSPVAIACKAFTSAESRS